MDNITIKINFITENFLYLKVYLLVKRTVINFKEPDFFYELNYEQVLINDLNVNLKNKNLILVNKKIDLVFKIKVQKIKQVLHNFIKIKSKKLWGITS